MTAIAMGIEPNEVYDELSLDERDIYDSIAANGFQPEMDGSRWAAVSRLTGNRVGPFPTLTELAEMTNAIVGEIPGADIENLSTSDDGENQEPDGVAVEIDEDHKGNTYLPGVKPVVDQQLADAAGAFHADDVAWSEAGKKRKASQAAISAIAELKRGLFRPDPDNSNSLIYHAGGLKIRIAKESKTKVTVEEEKED